MPAVKKHRIKRISKAQAQLVGGALGGLSAWSYASWVQGVWPPVPDAQTGTFFGILAVTAAVYLFTTEDKDVPTVDYPTPDAERPAAAGVVVPSPDKPT